MAALMLWPGNPASGQISAQAVAPDAPAGADAIQLDAAHVFVLAEQAEARGDLAIAETAYRALLADPDPELRTEARFRLALLLADRLARPTEAAEALRQILAEKPGAARVRIELARVEAMLGHRRASLRALRATSGAALPADVERMVRFYANALSALNPIGGSLELALTADSNVNRATRDSTLGTVLGDFVLSDDARARPAGGLSLQGQAYARTPIDAAAQLLVRASVSADLHPHLGQFDDLALSLQLGPEYHPGKDRITLAAGPVLRWYGRTPYSRAVAISSNWQHPLGRRGQLRLDGGVSLLNNLRNALEDSTSWSAALGVDRRFGSGGRAESGGGLQVSLTRTDARDPGYADVNLGSQIYGYRDLGTATLVATLGYTRLEADARLALYPRRRKDDRMSASASLTWHRARLAGLAPFVRVRAERARSSLGIYAYRRFAGELGLTSSF